MSKKEIARARMTHLKEGHDIGTLRDVLFGIIDALPEEGPTCEFAGHKFTAEGSTLKWQKLEGPEPVDARESVPTSTPPWVVVNPDGSYNIMPVKPGELLSDSDALKCGLLTEIRDLLKNADLGPQQRGDGETSGATQSPKSVAASPLWEGEVLQKSGEKEIYPFVNDTVAQILLKNSAWRRIKVKEVR